MKKSLLISLVMVAAALFMYFYYRKSPVQIITAKGALNVYLDFPANGLPGDEKILTRLDNEQTAVVLGETFSKDCKYYKIRLKNGTAGYVVSIDNFKITHE